MLVLLGTSNLVNAKSSLDCHRMMSESSDCCIYSPYNIEKLHINCNDVFVDCKCNKDIFK